MNIISAIVLYIVFWFLSLFVILPLRLTTQDEDGEVTPGTSPSAPTNPNLRKKAVWVTILAAIVWVPVVTIVTSGWISVDDFDFFAW